VKKDDRDYRDEPQSVDLGYEIASGSDTPKGIQRQFPQALSLRGNMAVSPCIARKTRDKSTQIYLISITSPTQIFKGPVLKTINNRAQTNSRNY
jgi:hypothetical protein